MMPRSRWVSIGLTILFLIATVQPARAEELPSEAKISGVYGHAQSYTLSCESRSAADWAAFWGFSITEDDLLAAMPRTDNPETGFVGNPNGAWGNIPPWSYGVHPPPLVAALRSLGVPAQEKNNLGWDGLRREIAAGRPVIAWIIGQMWNGDPIAYTASDGQTTNVAYYEHTMVVTGYSDQSVYVVDAYSGLDQVYAVDTFLASWSVLGQRAIVAGEEMPTRSTPVPGSTTTYTVQPGDTLARLASQFNLAWPDLAALNDLAYPYLLYTGQTLQVPGQAEAATETVTETPDLPAETPSPTPTTPPTAQAPTATPEVYVDYTVQAGDTLMRIAYRYELSWPDLVLSNEIPYPYTIYPGQVIRLPEQAGQPTPMQTQPSPSATPAVTATPIQPATTPEPTATVETYTVQQGEYLIELATRWGIEWVTLAELNDLQYPYQIYPGQVLRVR